jgi:hypothetical protein
MPKNILAFFIFSILIPLLSLLLPVKIYTSVGLSHINLGFPLHFLSQNYHFTPEKYPAYISFSSPWESPTHISFLFLLLDIGIVFFVLFLAFQLLRKSIKL